MLILAMKHICYVVLKPKAHFSSNALLCESVGANEPDWGHLKRICKGDVMQELSMCSDNSSIGSEEHTHMYSAEFTEGHEGIEEALYMIT